MVTIDDGLASRPLVSLSERLALVDIASIGVVELESLVAEEAASLFGYRRAAVWRHSATLETLFWEHDGVFAAVEVDRDTARALFEGHHRWPGDELDVLRRIVDQTFGAASAREPGTVLFSPLGESTIRRILVTEAMTPVAAADVEGMGVFVRQAGAVLASFDALERAHRNETHLEALNRTASEIASVLEIEDVLTAITERAAELLDAPIAYLLLVDKTRNEIAMRFAQGAETPEFIELRLALGEGVGGRVARQLEPFFTTDYLNDSRFDHDSHVDEVVRAEGIKSILSLPMHVFGELVGVMHVADRMPRSYSSDDIDVLMGLARHAALAIRNTQLYNDARNALRALEESNNAVRAQNERLERAQSVHQQLSEIVLAGQGLSGAVRLMAKALEVKVCILDDSLRPLEGAGDPDDAFGKRLFEGGVGERGVVRSAVEAVIGRLDVLEPARLTPAPPGRVRPWLVTPIVAGGHLLGSMWVESTDERLDAERELVEQAGRVLGLELLREQSVAEVGKRLRREFIDELLSPQPATNADLFRRGREHGLDIREPHHLLVVFVGHAEGVAADRARERALEVVRSYAFTDLAVDRGGALVALVAEQVHAHAEIGEALERMGYEHGLVAVLSAPCGGAREYRAAYAIAERFAKLFPPRRRKTSFLTLENARSLSLLFREGGEAEAREFVEAVLGPVVALKPDQSEELIRTLDAHMTADRRPAWTAKALHVHVNTVYYRLKQLESLLGPDFDTPNKLLDLRVALLVRRLLSEPD